MLVGPPKVPRSNIPVVALQKNACCLVPPEGKVAPTTCCNPLMASAALYCGFKRCARIFQPVFAAQIAAAEFPLPELKTLPATCPDREIALAKLSVHPAGTPRSCRPLPVVHRKAWS